MDNNMILLYSIIDILLILALIYILYKINTKNNKTKQQIHNNIDTKIFESDQIDKIQEENEIYTQKVEDNILDSKENIEKDEKDNVNEK